MGFPSLPLPLPASGRHWSVEACGPKEDTGNEFDESSFETQPMIGTVSALAILWSTLAWKNSLYEPTPWFSKYQSLPVFQVLSSQLYVDVVLPPQRRAVASSVH